VPRDVRVDGTGPPDDITPDFCSPLWCAALHPHPPSFYLPLWCTALHPHPGPHGQRQGRAVHQRYHDKGNLCKDSDALIKRQGHMINAKGERCITGYNKLSMKGNVARLKKCQCDAIALVEHHSHICISAICKRGASILLGEGIPQDSAPML